MTTTKTTTTDSDSPKILIMGRDPRLAGIAEALERKLEAEASEGRTLYLTESLVESMEDEQSDLDKAAQSDPRLSRLYAATTQGIADAAEVLTDLDRAAQEGYEALTEELAASPAETFWQKRASETFVIRHSLCGAPVTERLTESEADALKESELKCSACEE